VLVPERPERDRELARLAGPSISEATLRRSADALSPVVSTTVSARSRIGASSICSRWMPSATLPSRACGWRRRVSL
jgi:hypothetical protein